jgi:predicted RNA binding protein YcfA (HicA-like mRNA interferase family)
MRNNYYFVKIRGSYVNYLNLFSEPMRLRNTTIEKESIVYTANDIRKIIPLHPEEELKIEKKY